MDHSTARRWLVGTGIAAVAGLAVGRVRQNRATARRVDALYERARTRSDRTVRPADYADLPAPVERYFDAVLEAGRPYTDTVRLEQRGELRLGGRSGDWKPMTATQHYSVDPPGFVWDATVDIAPFVTARVVDAYADGRGSLQARLWSVVPVADADPGPAMNEAELQRYLGEAVWFPTALLPDAGVEWESVDDRSARATITDGDVSASLVVHFDADDLVERVHAERRYRQEDDDFAPWTGTFGDYRWHGDVRVPTEAAVAWNLPEGDLPYWRARVTAIEHRPAHGTAIEHRPA